MKYSKYAKQWANDKYDQVVINYSLISYKKLSLAFVLVNRLQKLFYYLYLKLGLFDIECLLVRKEEKLVRWLNNDTIYKHF